MAIDWIIPKTDWKSTDRFNISDYNRIRNDILFLRNKLSEINIFFEIEDMGDDMTDYSGYWDFNIFNAIEKNVEKINSRMEKKDFGETKTFFPNGRFVTFDELNRIENAILDMKMTLDNIEKGIRHIPFRLGSYKEIRI